MLGNTVLQNGRRLELETNPALRVETWLKKINADRDGTFCGPTLIPATLSSNVRSKCTHRRRLPRSHTHRHLKYKTPLCDICHADASCKISIRKPTRHSGMTWGYTQIFILYNVCQYRYHMFENCFFNTLPSIQTDRRPHVSFSQIHVYIQRSDSLNRFRRRKN